MDTLSNVNKQREPNSHANGLTSIANSKLNVSNGVSTSYVPAIVEPDVQSKNKQWYVLRTTYGRERKAYEYIISHRGLAYCPYKKVYKEIQGKLKTKLESLIPNILFAFGTFDEIEKFVYDNLHLPYLRFYYAQSTHSSQKCPLIIPERQMRNFRIMADSCEDDIRITYSTEKFTTGQKVRVIEGKFKGIEGIVSRWQGQQRVGIVIDGLCTIATAYIPSAFLEEIK